MPSLAEILILRGAVPIEALDRMTGDPVKDEVWIRDLIAEEKLAPVQLAQARAVYSRLPFVELLEYPVDVNAVALVPAAMCKRHEVLPIFVLGDQLTLAMVDPGDILALDDVRATTGKRVTPVVAERGDLLAAISRYHRADDEMSSLTQVFQEEQESSGSDLAPYAGASESSEDDAPIVRFVNLLISQAIQDQASDIHIEPGERALAVRYRIDGVLHEMQSAPKSIQNGVISRLKIMSEIDIAERRRPQDGRMSVVHGGKRIDLRVATLPTVHGEKVVMRILDNSNAQRSIEELHMSPTNFAAYSRSYAKPHGMILVTGPTGSGKSTTLYTTLHTVARPEINVITVEDPVEYRMAGINQVQVNVKAGLTFASALRSILRSDPDVVLLGEIRDRETAQIAIEASLTGHLVLSTLHTNDAPSAVTRLTEMGIEPFLDRLERGSDEERIDARLTEMGIEPFLVGSALESVVAQRLARRLCDRCREQVEAPATQLATVEYPVELYGSAVWRPVGCTSCSNTGYRGRIALHEVMTVGEEIERLAVAHASSAEIGRAARAGGMLTLRQDGWGKVAQGLTSIEEVLRVVA